ncbi:RES family NAD+ phosphorylase [Aquabacterium sp.]|uniref:RES family NAD+ phosphorylase n=1 Tax=Aquabacterium sp. TaxID=1872578 RepID=UPI0019AEEAE0|nr:RES family NAD+ phosphorylase [Aquabacterium sp.]MBC7701034.1 RES family NAD+ phosphorylase [Aquabacterium sp.]
MTPTAPEVRRLRWQPAYRIVPTRYPTVYLFDRVAQADDFDALYALESLTNERIRDEVGQVDLVSAQDRLVGPGSGPVMAAFTHLNPEGSRFSDGSYGVFYAAHDKDTAVAETQYHHARFLAATSQSAMQLPMRLYAVKISAQVHDLRPLDPEGVDVHAVDSYTASRALGKQLRQQGSAGVAYRSVRHPGGECVGLFKPKGASLCLHAAHLLYVWNGQAFVDVYEKLGA